MPETLTFLGSVPLAQQRDQPTKQGATSAKSPRPDPRATATSRRRSNPQDDHRRAPESQRKARQGDGGFDYSTYVMYMVVNPVSKDLLKTVACVGQAPTTPQRPAIASSHCFSSLVFTLERMVQTVRFSGTPVSRRTHIG